MVTGNRSHELEKVCYLCGQKATTRDHIPPASIFPKPRPSNLTTVPSCRPCNEDAQLDDEYFRLVVTTGSPDSNVAQTLVNSKIIRQFKRRRALLVEFMRGAIDRIEVRSPGGIILGHEPGFRFDRSRVQKIIDKTVRGLFYHHYDQRLPDDYVVRDYILNPVVDEAIFQELELAYNETEDKVFIHLFGHAVEDPNCTMWVLVFYGSTVFVVDTRPKSYK